MSLDALTEELEDWEPGGTLLPSGWQEPARLLGALRRARGFPNAALLLRTLLAHLVGDCSLQETTASAHLAGGGGLLEGAVTDQVGQQRSQQEGGIGEAAGASQGPQQACWLLPTRGQ